MDKKRAGVIKLLILAVVLVAAIITGFLTGAIQPDALASSWAFSADVLLRLVIMMAGVLFVEYLVELILGYCKPEAHRARSVITIIRSLLKCSYLPRPPIISTSGQIKRIFDVKKPIYFSIS